MTLLHPAVFLVSAAVLGSALAADLEVRSPWVRGTVPAQKATGAFMELHSKTSLTVTGATSPVAGVVEIHEMALVGNTMQMRPVARLEVPAGKAVELKPGGYHIMLMDLKQALTPGQSVPITLQFEKGGKQEYLELQVPVRSLTTPAAGTPGQMHGESR